MAITQQAHDLRGSVKLIRDRWGRPLEADHLDRIVELLDRHGVEVRDVLCIGIPDPEAVTGAITAKPDTLGPLVEDFLKVDGVRLRDLEVFPIGIPWPELLEVDFRFTR